MNQLASVFKTLASSIAIIIGYMLLTLVPAHADVQAKYNASCATCHQAGVLGAPKTGSKAQWKKALDKGMPTMLKNVKAGYKNMPARGLCDNCSDADYQALINFMTK